MRGLVTGGLVLLASSSFCFANDDFNGQWYLTLNQGRFVMEGVLDIRPGTDGQTGFVEGGPIELAIDGDDIQFVMDDRTATGMPFERLMRGKLQDGHMSGEFGAPGQVSEEDQALCARLPLACPAPEGTWTAVRHNVEDTSEAPPEPVDLSGAWTNAVGGIRRLTMDLTEAGLAWKAEFDVELDLPGQRCRSSGLVNGWGFRGNAPEIHQADTRITMILGKEVRRIYLDDRRPPEFTAWYPLGFSSGHWEGSTLVVETTFLQPSVREWNGDPVSENARVIERYSIDDQGRLVGVMTLHDPDYYDEPPVKRARWRPADDSAIRFPTLCDPDSFYRQLYDDNLFDEYWKRGHRRY